MAGDAECFSGVRGLGDVGVSGAPEQRPEGEPCGKGFQEGGAGTKARVPHWHCCRRSRRPAWPEGVSRRGREDVASTQEKGSLGGSWAEG